MVKKIPKQVLKGLKSIASETLEQGSAHIKKTVGLGENGKKGENLFPDIKDLNGEERARLEMADKAKGEKEMGQLRQTIGKGRDVESEIEMIRKQREEEEKRKEKELLENIKRQRQVEEEERKKMVAEVVTPGHKKKKSRGSAFAKGKKPTADTFSGEFLRKKD